MSIKLLKQKDFALLIMGKLISLMGSNIQQFALSLFVLAKTGSATIFASMLSISILPRLLLSPVAGVFGDWFNKKKSIIILDLINSIMIGIFAVMFFMNGDLSILLIYLIVILLEITEIFFSSSMAAVIPSLVKKEELLEANSLNSLVLTIGQLIAPMIAALIYGIYGLFLVLVINAISFFVSAISEMFINIPKNHKRPEKINLKSFTDDLKEGIKVIKENKFISTIIGIGTFLNFAIGPLLAVGLVYVIKEVLKASDFQFGIFEMVLSASMVTAPLLTGFLKKYKIGKLTYTSFIMTSILILLMALIPSSLFLNNSIPTIIPYILLLVVSFMIGVLVSIANITVGTMFNQVVPINLMGRTSTVFNLAVTVFIPVGQMLFGYLYDIIASSYVIAISGSIMLFAVLFYKKRLLQIDDNNEENEEDSNDDVLIEGGELINEV